jgi:hypothetical protein
MLHLSNRWVRKGEMTKKSAQQLDAGALRVYVNNVKLTRVT